MVGEGLLRLAFVVCSDAGRGARATFKCHIQFKSERPRARVSVPHVLSGQEDDFWVEEGASHASGDGNQVTLARKDFDLARAG